MAASYALEVNFLGKCNILLVSYQTSWEDLFVMLQCFLDTEDITIKYLDDENDEVSLSSEDEMVQVRQLARVNKDVIRIMVHEKNKLEENLFGPISSGECEAEKEECSASPPGGAPEVQMESLGEYTKPRPPDEFLDEIVLNILQGLGGAATETEVDSDPAPSESGSEFRRSSVGSNNAHGVCWSNAECYRESTFAPPSDEFVNKVVERVLAGLYQADLSPPVKSPPVSRSSSMEQMQGVLHSNVVCDVCGERIYGIRYKCGHCVNYDLCEHCESLEDVHDPNHVFLKIKRPALWATERKYNGKSAPLLKVPIYKTDEGLSYWEIKKVKYEQKVALKKFKHKMKEEKRKRKDVCSYSEIAPIKRERLEATSTTQTFVQPFLQNLKLQMDSRFVEDINVPDGMHMQSGIRFEKKWLMINSGSATWDSNTKLKFLWGNLPSISEDPMAVPPLEVGQQGSISVECLAPQKPGQYQSHWRLCQDGEQFGHRVWCCIVIDPEETVEVIDPEEMVEPEESLCQKSLCLNASDAVANLQSDQFNSSMPNKILSSTELLTAQDVLSYEMLNIQEKERQNMDRLSAVEKEMDEVAALLETATPNNTPCGMTPCMSPIPQLDELNLSHRISEHEKLTEQMRTTSIQEEENDLKDADVRDDSDGGLEIIRKEDVRDDDFSSGSSDDGLLDDFFIVPLPDCFDLNKPISESTCSLSNSSRSFLEEATEAASKKFADVDTLLATSHTQVHTEPLIPLTPATMVSAVRPQIEWPQVAAPQQGFTVRSPEIVLETVSATDVSSEGGVLVSPDGDAVPEENSHVVDDEDSGISERENVEEIEEETIQDITISERRVDTEEAFPNSTDAAEYQVREEEEVVEPSEEFHDAEDQPDGDEAPAQTSDHIPRDYPSEDATHNTDQRSSAYGSRDQNSEVQDILGYTAQRAAAIASTVCRQAYDVANATLSTVFNSPSSSTYPMPPPSAPSQSQDDAMATLIEMGFANRERNLQLLVKYNNDINQCVPELLSDDFADWHLTRH